MKRKRSLRPPVKTQRSPAGHVPFSLVETDRCACGGEMAIGTQAPILQRYRQCLPGPPLRARNHAHPRTVQRRHDFLRR